MSNTLAALLEAIIRLLTGLGQLWVAYRLGKTKAQAETQDAHNKVKDEQATLAADRPDDRNDLVRRLREHGL